MTIKGKLNTINMRGQRLEVGFIDLYEESWEDLRFPANAVAIGGLSSPPDVDADTGLLLFDGIATVETIAILAQMPHGKKIGSAIKPHIHWRKTSDAAGDVAWSFRYKWFNNGELEGDWSGLLPGTIPSLLDPGSTQQSAITTFGEVEAASDEATSSLFLCQLGRLPVDSSDTYEADVLLYEFDIHYQVDTLGSQEEFIKEDRV